MIVFDVIKKGWELIMLIHEKLKKSMRRKKIKQQYVADKMGVTKFFLSRILSGDRRITASDFLAICMVLGEDPANYLTCDELATVQRRMKQEKGAL